MAESSLAADVRKWVSDILSCEENDPKIRSVLDAARNAGKNLAQDQWIEGHEIRLNSLLDAFHELTQDAIEDKDMRELLFLTVGPLLNVEDDDGIEELLEAVRTACAENQLQPHRAITRLIVFALLQTNIYILQRHSTLPGSQLSGQGSWLDAPDGRNLHKTVHALKKAQQDRRKRPRITEGSAGPLAVLGVNEQQLQRPAHGQRGRIILLRTNLYVIEALDNEVLIHGYDLKMRESDRDVTSCIRSCRKME